MQPPLHFQLGTSVADDLFTRDWLLFYAGMSGDSEPTSLRDMHLSVVLCAVEVDIECIDSEGASKVHVPRWHASLLWLILEACIPCDLCLEYHYMRLLDVSWDAITSPTAVLDQFLGTYHHPDAPRWLGWTGVRTFLMGRAGFIGLFANMALWPENLAKVRFWSFWPQLLCLNLPLVCDSMGQRDLSKSLHPSMLPHLFISLADAKECKQRYADDISWLHRYTAYVFEESPTRNRSGNLSSSYDSNSTDDVDLGASGYSSAVSDILIETLPSLCRLSHAM